MAKNYGKNIDKQDAAVCIYFQVPNKRPSYNISKIFSTINTLPPPNTGVMVENVYKRGSFIKIIMKSLHQNAICNNIFHSSWNFTLFLVHMKRK